MIRIPSLKNTVLLVCDVQDKFRTAIYGFDAMTSSIAKMVKASELLEIPVLTTEQNPKALGATVKEIGLDSLPSSLNLGNLPKKKFSMVIPEIEAVFQQKKFENAIIVGIESHVCVLQTTLALLNKDVSVFVLADAVSSCNQQEVPIALERLRQAGAVITTTESILFQLVEDSALPIFKPFANLIKEEKTTTADALRALCASDSKAKL